MVGDWMSADKALQLGLVNQVVEPDMLLPTAMAIARKVGANNATTMRLMKQLLNAPLRSRLDEILDSENDAIQESVSVFMAEMAQRKRGKSSTKAPAFMANTAKGKKQAKL